MARIGRLLAVTHRLCSERGRRDAEAQPAQALLVVLLVVAVVRHLANAWLAGLVGPRLGPESGVRYLVGSAWLLALWSCTAGCARALRIAGVLLRHDRLGLAPLRHGVRTLTLAHAVLLRPTTAAVAALLTVSVATAAGVWGASALPAADLVALGAATIVLAPACLGSLLLWKAGDRALGYLELLALFALVYANPDVRVAAGEISIVLLNGAVTVPAGARGAILSLAAVAAALALIGLCAAAVRSARSRRLPSARPLAARDPLVRLWRADLPLAAFAVSYCAEGALVVFGSLGPAVLARLSGALLALRVGWYVLFVLRTEYRLADWRPAPLLAPRARLGLHARTAPAHTAACLAPALFWVARALRG